MKGGLRGTAEKLESVDDLVGYKELYAGEKKKIQEELALYLSEKKKGEEEKKAKERETVKKPKRKREKRGKKTTAEEPEQEIVKQVKSSKAVHSEGKANGNKVNGDTPSKTEKRKRTEKDQPKDETKGNNKRKRQEEDQDQNAAKKEQGSSNKRLRSKTAEEKSAPKAEKSGRKSAKATRPLQEMVFVTIGKFSGDIDSKIKEHGGKLMKYLGKSVTHLVAAAGQESTDKVMKAKNLGLTIINEKQLLEMVA